MASFGRFWTAITIVCWPIPVAAQVECATLNLPRPVFGTGSGSFKPTLRALASRLSALSDPVTLLYATPGGCHGVWSQGRSDYTIETTLSYWDATGTEYTCSPGLLGIPADFGAQAIDHTSCEAAGDLRQVGVFTGSVDVYSIVVNTSSSQTSISTEALYYVFGFGADGRAEPWTDEATILTRPPEAVASILLGELIGVPPERFRGTVAPQEALFV